MTNMVKFLHALKKVLGRPVRMSVDDTRVALIDVIMAVCFVSDNNRLKPSAQKNASDYLHLMASRSKQVFDGVTTMCFKGQGQKPTPVMPISLLLDFMQIMTCKVRKPVIWKQERLNVLGCSVAKPDKHIRVFVECEVMQHIKKALAACKSVEQYPVGC